MHVSDGGLTFLVGEEGSIPYAYNDPSGFATFGVGHLIGRRRVTPEDAAMWGSKAHPRPDRVLPTLRRDLASFEAAVTDAVHVPLNANEFDALVSLAFNIGVGAFRGSTLVKRLNAGDRPGAAAAFLMWANSAGKPILLGRRKRERELFETAVKPAGAAAWLRPDELRWIREYDSLVRAGSLSHRVLVLRRVMIARRKSIWHEAQTTGWAVNDRRKRYDSLVARTR